MVDFLSQFRKVLRILDEVKEEGGEDHLRGIRSGDDDKVTIVEDNIKRYFFLFCTEFVGLPS